MNLHRGKMVKPFYTFSSPKDTHGQGLSNKQNNRALYHACVLKYVAAKYVLFLKTGYTLGAHCTSHALFFPSLCSNSYALVKSQFPFSNRILSIIHFTFLSFLFKFRGGRIYQNNFQAYRTYFYALLRSVWLHLVDKMSVHLARIISVLDRNCGLEHLHHNDPTWSRQLFVRLLDHLDVDAPANSSTTFK